MWIDKTVQILITSEASKIKEANNKETTRKKFFKKIKSL